MFVFLCGFFLEIAAESKIVLPEMFGAVGDGINDDSKALEECLKSGQTIWLGKGKTYRLCSRIATRGLSRLVIKGNGAKIVVSEQYPVTQYDIIFCINGNEQEEIRVNVSDLEIVCELGQKFEDREEKGDTDIFYVTNGGWVQMSNVRFATTGQYNNVSFLVSTGNNILFQDCDIRLNTLSKQGGVLWLMNKTEPECDIKLENCRFEYESQDECMCFSGSFAGRSEVASCSINASIENCDFVSSGLCRSSGFIIAYNHSGTTTADIHIQYEKTRFHSSGSFLRRIQTYQCGNDSIHNYGRFLTSYKNCLFEFSTTEIMEGGILGLLPLIGNSVNASDIGYEFRKCTFDIANINMLIGDKDGNKKGFYHFNNCDISSNRSLFLKKYNSGTGDIEILLKNTRCQSIDEFVTKERLVTHRSFFNGKKL